jgi:hypothetical protein
MRGDDISEADVLEAFVLAHHVIVGDVDASL